MVKRLPGPLFPNIKIPSVKTPRIKGKRNYFIVIGAIVVLGGLGWLIFQHFNNKNTTGPSAVVTDFTLTNQQKVNSQNTAAQTAIKNKDYTSAVSFYQGAADDAFIQKDYNQSKNLLQTCISTVPDQAVPWYIYASLATTAQKLNDKTLQKNSLQMAIKKAQLPDSGAAQSTIDFMNKQLAGL